MQLNKAFNFTRYTSLLLKYYSALSVRGSYKALVVGDKKSLSYTQEHKHNMCISSGIDPKECVKGLLLWYGSNRLKKV